MKRRLRFYTKTALAAAILSLLSPLSIPLGVFPLTLCSLAISLVSGLFGAGVGFLAVCVYLAIGAVGVPVFSGFSAGFGALLGPSIGFFVGYLALSLIAGQVARLSRAASPARLLPLLLLGELLLLSFGAVGYAIVLELSLAKAALAALLPFLLPAIIKALSAACLLARLRGSRFARSWRSDV